RLNAALQGRYRIERELGEGGMATVFLAEDVKHDRKVALKVLKPELAAVVGAERFVAEIRTTANLRHPHILPLFDSGEADGFLYYVMPYVEGESLRERLDREKQLPVDQAVAVATKVAGALQAAHDAGVIHRDIKPANILLEKGEPVVADFGIALAVQEAGGGRLTETGLSLGTPFYMSPEQATGDRDPDARSDVYALGAVLYEMLTGDPPFVGSTAQAVLGKILTGDVPRPAEVRKSIPANVEATVLTALQRIPADRFHSAGDMAAALSDPGFRSRAAGGRDPVRHRSPIVAMAVSAAATAVLMLLWLRPTTVPPPVPRSFAVDVGDHTLRSDLVISPDGSALAYYVGQEGLFVRSIDEPEFRLIHEHGLYPTFSPDGEWIAVVDRSSDPIRRLIRIPVAGGTPVTILESDSLGPFDPYWGADDTIVFLSLAGGGTYRVPAFGTATPEKISSFTGRNPTLLPDGSGVLLTPAQQSTSLHLLDLRSDGYPARPLIEDASDAQYVDSGHILFAHADGGLHALPFDLDAHQVTGAAFPLLEDIGSEGLARGYSVSRDGTLVYAEGEASFRGRAELQLVWMARDGRADTLRGLPGRPAGSRVSPDGDRIAFTFAAMEDDADRLVVFDLATSAATTLVTGREVSRPIWSPDGTRIAYSALPRRDDSMDRDIFTMSVDGTDERRLVSLPGRQIPQSWPAEERFLFESYLQVDNRDLWIGSTEGGEPEPYLRALFSEGDAAVSPDGRWTAYVSSEKGQPGLFLRPFPEPTGQIEVASGGHAPRWSPNGDVLYYTISESFRTPRRLMAVDVSPDGSVGEARELHSGFFMADWDVHPDGERFLLTMTGGSNEVERERSERSVRYRVVTDWFEVLRRRAEEGKA
ncbi:MAG: serine/threonine-protein kinase, partial [Gemmatimonadales bacterium]